MSWKYILENILRNIKFIYWKMLYEIYFWKIYFENYFQHASPKGIFKSFEIDGACRSQMMGARSVCPKGIGPIIKK